MTTQYIIKEPNITTFAVNSVHTLDEIILEIQELQKMNPQINIFEISDYANMQLAEVTDIVNNETSCVIEHSKETVSLASLLL